MMKITIAICTWNRCELLKQTLEHMVALDIPDWVTWDILVVDNNCSDATQQVIESFGSRLPIRTVMEPMPGLCNARNRAIASTDADLLVFTDDDVLVSPTWIAALAAAARRHPEAAAFVGPVEPWFPALPDPLLADVFPELKRGFCSVNIAREEQPLADELIDSVYGVNMAFRMSHIESLRFDPRFGPTHVDPGKAGDEAAFMRLIRRHGGLIVWCPTMTLLHFVDPSRMKLEYLLKFSAGRGRMLVRRDGVSGVLVCGIPRWMLVLLIRHTLRYAVFAVGRDRRRALAALREHFRLRGMISESRLLRREVAL